MIFYSGLELRSSWQNDKYDCKSHRDSKVPLAIDGDVLSKFKFILVEL